MTPLHEAVISNDIQTVTRLKDDPRWSKMKDPLGFLPLELAQLLGHRDCQELLGGEQINTIAVRLKGEKNIKRISTEQFRDLFNVVYSPFLNFNSYRNLKAAIDNCPYLLKYSWLAQENHLLGIQLRSELACGYVTQSSIQWINDDFGYGLFADTNIQVGDFVGEYTGYVRRLYRKHPDQNAYCMQYPTRFWSFNYYVVDALREGNTMRFINHSDSPNLYPVCLVDRGILHQVFLAKINIEKGTQLTVDYGEDYWLRRKKHFLP